MRSERALLTADLFDSVPRCARRRGKSMAEGAVLLRGFARPVEADLIAALRDIVAQAPFRHMVTPGGHQMSVAMTNCGALGWVTDRTGYRYDADDPETGQAVAGDAAIVSRARRAGGRRRRLRRICAGCMPDQSLRAGRAHVAASGQGRARFRRADRLGVAGPARDLPVRRIEAQRQAAAVSAASMATSWCGAARRGSPFTASRRSPTASTP